MMLRETDGSKERRKPGPAWPISVAAAVLSLLMVAACGAPGAGPSAGGVESSAAFAAQGSFPVVELTNSTLSLLGEGPSSGLAGLGNRRFDGSLLRPGDQIEVKIFDTGEEGLLSSADSKTLDLGRFRIESDGSVSLPYAGRLDAAGRSPAALQDQIAERLKGTSVSPQAAIHVSQEGGSGFTVNGDVNGAGRFTLSTQSERVLDAIAMAGGPSSPPGETAVTVIRGSRRATVPMDRLIAEPAQNIYVRPNDQIFVRRESPSYTSFGAFKSPGEFTFETDQLTLAQAIARSGGLLDDRANPKKVYLFRYEPADIARLVGAIPQTDPRTVPVPLVYSLDMTKTSAFFIAQSFLMKNRDILYVPNSPLANFGKLFQVFEKVPATPAAPLPNAGS